MIYFVLAEILVFAGIMFNLFNIVLANEGEGGGRLWRDFGEMRDSKLTLRARGLLEWALECRRDVETHTWRYGHVGRDIEMHTWRCGSDMRGGTLERGGGRGRKG